MQRHNTVVLGASGLVAQRMQQRLVNHPWFILSAVVGSERTAGQPLSSIPWNLSEPRPNLPQMTVLDGLEKNLIERLVELNVTVANYPSASCSLIGWMLDGFPLVTCADSTGQKVLKSCYT